MFDQDYAEGCGVELQSGMGELDDVAHAVAILQKVDWAGLPAEILGEAAVDFARLGAAFTSAELACLDQFDKRGHELHQGFPSAYVTRRTKAPKYRNDQKIRVARGLRSLPVAKDALAKGQISFDHASTLATLTTNENVAWALAEAERDDLVPAARRFSWKYFQRIVNKFIEVADLDQGSGDEDEADRKRSFSASKTFDGHYRVDGWLDPVMGEIFHDELARIEKEMFEVDWAIAEQQHGKHTTPGCLRRTPKQRRHDALIEMARRSAASNGSAKPCLNIHIDHESFTQGLREQAGLPAVYPTNGIRQTQGGQNVSVRQAIAAAFEGHVRRLVFRGDDNQLVNMSPRRRFFTGQLREAIELRDRTCTHPLCELPAMACHMDHIEAFGLGGSTIIENGQALCSFHNRQKGQKCEPWWNTEKHQLVWLSKPPAHVPQYTGDNW